MKRPKVLFCIIFVLVFTVVIIFLLSFVLNNKNENTIKNIQSDNIVENKEINLENDGVSNKQEWKNVLDGLVNKKLEDVYESLYYFDVKNIIDKYYYECNNLSPTNIILPRTGIKQEEIDKYIKEQKEELSNLAKKSLKNILGKQYLKEFNINENNIKNKFSINYSYELLINNLKFSHESNNIITFIVSGMIFNTENGKKEDFKNMITIDTTTSSYSIYPQEFLKKHQYDKLKSGDNLETGIVNIENNLFNTIEDIDDTDENMCKEYLKSLKVLAQYNPDYLYNLLDTTYAEKRFGNKDNFIKYIKDNSENLQEMYFNKYAVIDKGNSKYYECIDNNENHFRFIREKSILNYKVMLDDYTIMDSAAVASYSKKNEEQKANFNLNKFIKMLNNKDYNAIYNSLDSNFKNNNFKTVMQLQEYINKNFYYSNEIEKLDKVEQDNYYAYTCKLINQKNTEERKKISIIISKTDDTNFTMSFSFE